MTISEYITTINQRYKLGNATEHTFRGDLQQLLESLVTDIRATNEPKRQSCGAPDYIITRGEIPVGFIEAKDIGDKDLEGKKKTGNQEQFDRYKTGLSNLIITDYIDFIFYRDGVFTTKISIGKIENGSILPLSENFDQFSQLFKNFTETISQSIKSPTRLAKMMAGKARLMADIIEKSLNEDDEVGNLSNLKKQMLSFQKMLIHDIENKSFSDIYSQTIAYGMFAARYHDPSLPTFSREEAVKLIPKSNPFLRKLFKDIADEDLDYRLVWIVDELVNVFLASDVASIMKNFGKSTKQEDPVVHFYETFLGSYNPALRKARGVWYTPAPVVNFIVRAVDDILKTEFDLPEGLADKSKKKIKVNYQGKEIEKEVHRVQVLDPATGTGTFLAETIKHIHKKYEGMQGIWSKYVEDDLIPRLNGFELLMASYAMAHLKLDMLLTDTGYVPTKEQRLRVFLTNSLEEPHADSGTLWGNLLSEEADQANEVKRDTPVMCVIGNPPYSGESANKGEWIMKLMDDYKKEPGGKEKLQERNAKGLNDDYVKFIRLGQYLLNKNGSGILAFINPHGYTDNATFRGMRWSLMNSFDDLYILDLNGNVKKGKKGINGEIDENVFDITTGVSINVFIKHPKKSEKRIFYHQLIGKRGMKYEFLNENTLKTIKFETLKPESNDYFLCSKDFIGTKEYKKNIPLDKLFNFKLSGLSTKNDDFCVSIDKQVILQKVNDLKSLPFEEIKTKYLLQKESSSWSLNGAINDIKNGFDEKKIIAINYRPFDYRYTYYTGKSMGYMGRPKGELGKHLLKENLCLITLNKSRSNLLWNFIGVSKHMICEPTSITSLDGNYGFPLYLYADNKGQQSIDQTDERTPNLNIEIVNQIAENVGLTFTNEKETTKDTFAPIDILDYIYAVLHSTTYREKYKEFLKIDFPRVPYPKDKDTFWKLVKLGGEIRQIHLLESPIVEKYISKYPHTGTNIVGKPKYENGKVMINETQFFEDVPEVAWNFYIGGYQPAQKWLKDRKDRELQIDDIRHYMKIIVALTETDRLMKEIDTIEIESK